MKMIASIGGTDAGWEQGIGMSGNKETKQFTRSFSHLLKRAVQYSVHLYMNEVGKTGLTHRQFTVLSAVEQLNIPGLSQADLKNGKISVVNIFASWCVPCREEQPLLMALSQRSDIQLVGINNKDAAADVRNFLGTYGNPFTAIGADTSGRATINWGSYGVPETFIVDGNGVIRYKVIGGLAPSIADGSFVAEIQKAALPLKQ